MFSNIFNLNFPSLEVLLSLDPNRIDAFHKQCRERIFHARHVGITSQELQSWDNQDFLPYQYEGTGWRQFSFFEYVWLKSIQKLRKLDLSHKKIIALKEVFFTLEKQELIRIIQLTPLLKDIGMHKYLLLAELELDDERYEEAKTIINALQLSRFSMLVIWILLVKSNLCLIIDENQNISFVEFGSGDVSGVFNNEISPGHLQHQSYILLNLRSIVLDFFDDEKLVLPPDYVIGFLTEGQKKILDELKAKDLKSITIRFNDEGNPTHIELTRAKITKDVLNKVARLLNKKDFQNIELKKRDGKLIKYEETDIKKL